ELVTALRRNPLGVASAGIIVLLALTATFADVVAPYDPLAPQPEIRLSAPSRAHPFGTDDIGRDVLSRVIYGSRISLWVGLLGVGTQPPEPSWGLMLSTTGRAFFEQAPWLAVFPGLAISLAVLGFNLFGDTLRDAWDPKLRRSG